MVVVLRGARFAFRSASQSCQSCSGRSSGLSTVANEVRAFRGFFCFFSGGLSEAVSVSTTRIASSKRSSSNGGSSHVCALLLFLFCLTSVSFCFSTPRWGLPLSTVGATPCPIWGLPLSTVGLTPAMGSTPLRWVASVLGAAPESPGKLYSLCHPQCSIYAFYSAWVIFR